MVGLAAAFAAGLALAFRGAPLPPAPLLLLLLLSPIALFLRPRLRRTGEGFSPEGSSDAGSSARDRAGVHGAGWGPHAGSGIRGRAASSTLLLCAGIGAIAGLATGRSWVERQAADCRHRLREGPVRGIRGRFLGWPGEGGVPFRVEAGLPGGCRGEVRAYLDRALLGGWGRGGGRSGGDAPPGVGERVPAPDAIALPGAAVEIRGAWRRSGAPDPTRPGFAGYLTVEAVRTIDEPGGDGGSHAVRGAGNAPPDSARSEPVTAAPPPWSGWHLRVRGRVQERLRRLFPRRAAVAEALVLARKEGLDPEVRDAFARSGTAHLLAISGFHVGVVAGLVLAVLRLLGLGPRRSPAVAAGAAWAYVLWIGAPDAAVRAALLLGLLAVGRPRGVPVAPLGALATAFLVLLLVDPGKLIGPGFQLSFAGVTGLILWARPIERALRGPGPGPIRSFLAPPVAAAVAATAATLPLVAWHFGRVPVAGIPATLATTPVISAAIPGIFAVLLIDPVVPAAATFLAGGVELLLDGAVGVTGWVAGLPGAAPWVPRSWVPAAAAGLVVGTVATTRLGGFRGWRRRTVVAAWLVGAIVVVPAAESLARRGALEIAVIDVGQGDAIAIRSPAGRWILVDAGPRSPTYDAGARRVVPWLRRRGADRLEALVLTHPDLDHLGGAPAVLEEIEVQGVVDPGVANARRPFARVLEAAERLDVGWWRASRGRIFEIDGVELRVLHSGPPPEGMAVEGTESNAFSVVMLLRFGSFRALLTGDAPAAVETMVARGIEAPIDLLKVGHHGSFTSTGVELLERVRPEVAVIPVGRRNRFGHPHPEVLARLRGGGVRILRTDLHGTVTVRARRDGSWSAEVEREGAGG